MPELLTGTVTFLFTDVEGSTELLERAPDVYAQALDEHRRLLRDAAAASGGQEVDCRGEEFFFAFARAEDGVAAAADAQSRLAAQAWPPGGRLAIRMGIHSGQPTVHDEGYLGLDVHRAARICSLAHGGQVLISETTRDQLAGKEQLGFAVRELGTFRLKGFSAPEPLFQLDVDGLPSEFPAPRRPDPGADPGSAGREHELAAAALKALPSPRSVHGLWRRLARGQQVPKGLADIGWEVRARLPAAPTSVREGLAELGGELFSGSRSVVAIDRYLADVDRKRLDRLLAEHTELGVLSKRAAAEAEATARRLALLDALAAARRDADARIEEIGVAVEQLCAQIELQREARIAEGIAGARRAVGALTAELDHALEQARAEVAATGGLRRTRRRGIYRRGSLYVVPYVDEVGVEHEGRFDSLAAARAFRDARRLGEGQIDFTGTPRDLPIEKAEYGRGGGG